MGDLSTRTIDRFLKQLASASPTPGGGSVAALSAATSASLGMMVCALATKKEESLELNDLEARLSSLKEGFLHLAEKDEEAFTAVMAAYRLPREDERRRPAIEGALLDAAEVPLKVASDGVSLLSLLVVLVPLGTRQSVSDVGVAAIMGKGAIEAALLNVRINLAYMKDKETIARLTQQADEIAKKGVDLAEQVRALVGSRLSP
jgi:formiminotetrahydrofolate cyclodeaminase